MKYVVIVLLLIPAGLFGQHPFFEKYGDLETIAGMAQIEENGENGWSRRYERDDPTKIELSRPHFAMADKEGNIYIADKNAHAIRMIRKRDGRIYTVAGTNEAGFDGDGTADRKKLDSPNGLYVLPDGTFYILDLGNSAIRKVKNGKITTVLKDPDSIEFGRGLWVSPGEDTIIYSSGNRLRIWTGKEVATYADGFDELGNICIDQKGNLIVTDRDRGKVYRFNNQTGEVDHIAGNGEDDDDGDKATEVSLEGVRAVWPTDDGGLLVGCHESHDIWYISTEGNAYKFVDGKKDAHDGDGEPFNSDGKKISETRSVTIDYEGNIIICEHDGGYIRRIERIK